MCDRCINLGKLRDKINELEAKYGPEVLQGYPFVWVDVYEDGKDSPEDRYQDILASMNYDEESNDLELFFT